MAAPIGIHVGNTSACLSVIANGAASVIANDSGDRVTPAVVALNGHEWEVGLPAKSGQARGKPTVTNNKRLLNLDWNEDDLQCVQSSSSCKIITDEERVKYEFTTEDNSAYTNPPDIATKMYAKLFTIASHSGPADADMKLVLAAPLNWTLESRQRLTKAAELAGFEVLQVITEPAAALLAYNFGELTSTDDCNVLVYRLGGTSCDTTIVKASKGFLTIVKNIHRPDLGGKCLTRDLADYIAQEFAQKWKLDPRESRRAMTKLFHHADNCKHVLSTLSSAHVFIESLLDGIDWSQNVSRARFENITSAKISSYMEPINDILEGFDGNIDKIILCGGSMKIPKLQSAVASLFPKAEVLSRISPDEVIAEGCAKQAAYLLDVPELNLEATSVETDFLTKDIFLKYSDKSVCLFPEGSCLFSQTILDIDLKDAKTLDAALYINYNGDCIGTESFSIENSTDPVKLKATLQLDKVLLELEQ